MFSGFSEKTGSFLWELAFNNERPWFLAHKQEFEDFVNTPFKALAADSQALRDGPAFWFEIGPSSYAWGMGWYGAAPTQMEFLRRSVDANPTRFLRLIQPLERKGWMPGGEPYKRPKALHDDVLLDDWYNRRWMGTEKSFDWGSPAYTASLTGAVVDAWAELMPLYRYLMEIYHACPRETDRH